MTKRVSVLGSTGSIGKNTLDIIRRAKPGDELSEKLAGADIELGFGPDAIIEAASMSSDFTMAAIIGSAGLKPTLAAVEQGNHIGF